MSLLPLNQNKEKQVWYGTSSNREETELLVGVPGKARYIEFEVAEVIFDLFIYTSWKEVNEHPKANPRRAPEKRFQRHRNYYIYWLNQFRHWWKTSRLLLRTSGGYEFCLDPINWELMGTYLVRKRRQAAKALKRVKKIGRGGPVRDFLVNVKPVSFVSSSKLFLISSGWKDE